ncbi:MAG TPA: undecaprenyldiphospho-muramoylpentapeptide beta-N-acetylglucosaminyltransferase [Coriobacteriia bacterium]
MLSGGGTAGHIYPALTVAELLSAGGHEVAFVGTPDGLEARLVPEAGVAFFALPARGFDRSRPLSLLAAAWVIAASTLRAWLLLGREHPDVVLGFGGYVSLPVGFAAVARRIPLVLHEQNSVPGLANKALSRWARRVGITYEGSKPWLAHPERAVLTGNPVRAEVLAAERETARAALGLPQDAIVLLVFGGSRGARHLNQATIDLYSRLSETPRLHVIHAAGSLDLANARDRLDGALEASAGKVDEWRLVEYLPDMPSAIASADLVVARAGATSIAEITAIGRAAVLVPYPYATDDHQTLNARAVEEASACMMVTDASLDSALFADAIMRLLSDRPERERMAAASAALGRRDAAQCVQGLAVEAARGPSHEAQRKDSE